MSKKDAYWFKHDSTAGRGLRIKKIQHIYGHWGKGIYWDVIEVLREQSNYCFDNDESSLQMLCELIGCKDIEKFFSWYKDCIRLELFIEQENKFLSEVLCEIMQDWEKQKSNGNKGGRPTKTQPITQTKPKRNPTHNPNGTIREEERREEKKRELTPSLNSFKKEKISSTEKMVKEERKKFEDSPIFAKSDFSAAFPNWNKAKKIHYHSLAEKLSAEGTLYANWMTALNYMAIQDKIDFNDDDVKKMVM